MDGLRQPMMDVTNNIRWIPDFGQERELDWLRNMHDWMISKKRYWGLALPIFDCQNCGHFEVIGSREELKERAVEGWAEFVGHSPHRPLHRRREDQVRQVRRDRRAHQRRGQSLARCGHRLDEHDGLSPRSRILAAVVPGGLHHRIVPRPVPQLVLLAAGDGDRRRQRAPDQDDSGLCHALRRRWPPHAQELGQRDRVQRRRGQDRRGRDALDVCQSALRYRYALRLSSRR